MRTKLAGLMVAVICMTALGSDLTQSITVPSQAASAIPFVGLDIDHARGDGTYVVFHDWRSVAGTLIGQTSFIDQSDGTHVVAGFSSDGQGNYSNLHDNNGGADIAQFLTANLNYSKPFLVQVQSQAGPNSYVMFPVSAILAVPPSHGVFQFVTSSAAATQYKEPLSGSYIPNDGFTGQETVLINYVVNGGTALSATLTITVSNAPPSVVTTSVSEPILPGQSVAFAGSAADSDHNLASFIWDFGDGTSGAGTFASGISGDANTTHTYAAPGVYLATFTATDAGGLSSNSTQTVTVFSTKDEPLASFVTSAINATVGLPIGFDATFTTDPGNKIAGYSWDFGDGTPLGTGVVLAHIYSSIGTYTTTLTVTDSNGLKNSVSAAVVVVDAATGTSTPLLLYTARFNTKKSNADSLQVLAKLNPGATVTSTTPLGVKIAGSSFTGVTGTIRTLKNATTQVKWTMKPVKNAPGVVQFKATVRNASLLGFPSSTGTFTTPVKLSVGERVFSTPVTNSFRFGLGGGVAASGK